MLYLQNYKLKNKNMSAHKKQGKPTTGMVLEIPNELYYKIEDLVTQKKRNGEKINMKQEVLLWLAIANNVLGGASE